MDAKQIFDKHVTTKTQIAKKVIGQLNPLVGRSSRLLPLNKVTIYAQLLLAILHASGMSQPIRYNYKEVLFAAE